MEAVLNLVLYQPEIPPNTGNIARMCAAFNLNLHLIHPLGFRVDEKAIKRSGMDYWHMVEVREWESWDEFEEMLLAENAHFHLLTTKTDQSFYKANFKQKDYIIFGRETKGLPESLLQKYAENCLTIPMSNAEARSLNLSTAAAMVTAEAIRQLSHH
ncbi:MAG: tRNA (cytidine(34)-2'-O)-methyltransferase [Verrucomicrobiota bacterium]